MTENKSITEESRITLEELMQNLYSKFDHVCAIHADVPEKGSVIFTVYSESIDPFVDPGISTDSDQFVIQQQNGEETTVPFLAFKDPSGPPSVDHPSVVYIEGSGPESVELEEGVKRLRTQLEKTNGGK